jgi:hypothetical protein
MEQAIITGPGMVIIIIPDPLPGDSMFITIHGQGGRSGLISAPAGSMRDIMITIPGITGMAAGGDQHGTVLPTVGLPIVIMDITATAITGFM